MAKGSVTQSVKSNIEETLVVVTLEWTADSGGELDATALEESIQGKVFGKYLIQVITVPGGRAPSSNYDITITDANSFDLMTGKLANRSASAAEGAFPLYFTRPVDGSLTLNLSGNSTDQATGKIILYFSTFPISTGLLAT